MTVPAEGTPRVLIVEDEAITALDLSAELTSLGYDICGVVDTADDAFATAIRERPALVLMDVRLADGGDGIETARRIGCCHDAAIVFLTAHSDEATLARALAVSPFGYLIKPFRSRELKVAINLALAKHAKDSAATRDLLALATTDPLTGLVNRRQLDATLEFEWARCRREGRGLAVAMIDVDHFKTLNDACGHLAGDRCLREVAGILQRVCVGSKAVLGRWGGEEFLVILPESELEDAIQIAEHLVNAVRAAALPHAASPLGGYVTVSAGVASMLPRATVSPETLVELADRGLYAAKRAGRNRVATAPIEREGWS